MPLIALPLPSVATASEAQAQGVAPLLPSSVAAAAAEISLGAAGRAHALITRLLQAPTFNMGPNQGRLGGAAGQQGRLEGAAGQHGGQALMEPHSGPAPQPRQAGGGVQLNGAQQGGAPNTSAGGLDAHPLHEM